MQKPRSLFLTAAFCGRIHVAGSLQECSCDFSEDESQRMFGHDSDGIIGYFRRGGDLKRLCLASRESGPPDRASPDQSRRVAFPGPIRPNWLPMIGSD